MSSTLYRDRLANQVIDRPTDQPEEKKYINFVLNEWHGRRCDEKPTNRSFLLALTFYYRFAGCVFERIGHSLKDKLWTFLLKDLYNPYEWLCALSIHVTPSLLSPPTFQPSPRPKKRDRQRCARTFTKVIKDQRNFMTFIVVLSAEGITCVCDVNIIARVAIFLVIAVVESQSCTK